MIKGGIAVFYHEDQVFAVDNRCPHMGFPLHMGSLCDGILTCHWHHARFDVCSGGTLDPWADDVPTYSVKVDKGEVWVDPRPKIRNDLHKLKNRLKEGLEQNISLVIAKAVVGLVEAGMPDSEIAKVGVEFGTTYRTNGWGSGLTILTAMVNTLPKLDKYGRILALFQGLVHVARDSSGRGTRFVVEPLPDTDISYERLSAWYRQCVEVRDVQGAERVLITAIRKGASKEQLSEMMLVAATDHFYLDGGHTLDFHNKAFEILEYIGIEHRERVLTSLVPLVVRASRSEEMHSWQSPINLVAPLHEAFRDLLDHASSVSHTSEGKLDAVQGHAGERKRTEPALELQALLDQLLSDHPLQTIEMMTKALKAGMPPDQLAQIVALAAAERIARFHTQNDFGDWISVLHTFTHAHAVHESMLRESNPLSVRALYYAAVSIYLDRFLNIPTAPRPNAAQGAAQGYSTDPKELLDMFNQQQQVTAAGQWLAHYLNAEGDKEVLFNTLGHSLLREDAEFHSYQMVEAALAEYDRWSEADSPLADRAKETMILAMTRYLAAHAPTSRELPHVARIAWRLHRGERLFEEG